MKPKELILQRFAELLAEVPKVKTRSVDGKEKRVLHPREWRKWSLSAAHLISAAMGDDSAHYKEFWRSDNIVPPDRRVQIAGGILEAAKEDFERGLNFNLETRLTGEIFADFIGLAKRALEDGYKDVAAVLACAALEDTIKRLAKANGIENANDIEANINYLKSKGYFSGSVKKVVATLPGIRNNALHADWGNVSDFQVRTTIAAVESLLFQHF